MSYWNSSKWSKKTKRLGTLAESLLENLFTGKGAIAKSDMQFISKFNKGYRFLLFIIDIFSKYAWVVPLKDKKGISIVNAFQKILDNANLIKYGLIKEVNFTIILLKNG